MPNLLEEVQSEPESSKRPYSEAIPPDDLNSREPPLISPGHQVPYSRLQQTRPQKVGGSRVPGCFPGNSLGIREGDTVHSKRNPAHSVQDDITLPLSKQDVSPLDAVQGTELDLDSWPR